MSTKEIIINMLEVNEEISRKDLLNMLLINFNRHGRTGDKAINKLIVDDVVTKEKRGRDVYIKLLSKPVASQEPEKEVSIEKKAFFGLVSRRSDTCSFSDFIKWWRSTNMICFYCGITIEKFKTMYPKVPHTRLTIDRRDNNKGYIPENMVFACLKCNSLKGNFFTEEEMLEVGAIVRRKHEAA